MAHSPTTVILDPTAEVTPMAGLLGEAMGACYDGNGKALLVAFDPSGALNVYRTIAGYATINTDDSCEFLSEVHPGPWGMDNPSSDPTLAASVALIDGDVYVAFSGYRPSTDIAGTYIYRDTGGGGAGPWVLHGTVQEATLQATHQPQKEEYGAGELLVQGTRWVLSTAFFVPSALPFPQGLDAAKWGIFHSDDGGVTWVQDLDQGWYAGGRYNGAISRSYGKFNADWYVGGEGDVQAGRHFKSSDLDTWTSLGALGTANSEGYAWPLSDPGGIFQTMIDTTASSLMRLEYITAAPETVPTPTVLIADMFPSVGTWLYKGMPAIWNTGPPGAEYWVATHADKMIGIGYSEAVVPPPPPSGVSAVPDCTTLLLSWTPPEDADFFEVFIDEETPINVGLDTSYLFDGLAEGSEHTVGVRASTGDVYSDWVSVTQSTNNCAPADCTDCDDETWLIETCDIKTGLVLNVLDPLGFDFQVSKNAVGQGTMTFPTQGVRVQDIWPYLSLIAISKITDDPDNPEGLFLGIVDSFEAQSSEDGGTTTVGLLEITHYLWRRLIRADHAATDWAQTLIARDLVGLTSGEIPLYAIASPSNIQRTFQWAASERYVIGDEVAKLTTMVDGPDWETTYTRTNGAWSATMRFADEVGVLRETVLSSDREGASYSLSVDGAQQATLIDGFAPSPEGEETEVVIVTEEDITGPYPLLEAAVSYSDLPLPDWTDPAEFTRPFVQGDLANRKEPAAVPSMTIAGPVPPPSELKVGDEVTVNINHGAITYYGQARVIDISWRVQSEAPDLRTLGFEPISRPSESVLNQVPADDCEDC